MQKRQIIRSAALRWLLRTFVALSGSVAIALITTSILNKRQQLETQPISIETAVVDVHSNKPVHRSDEFKSWETSAQQETLNRCTDELVCAANNYIRESSLPGADLSALERYAEAIVERDYRMFGGNIDTITSDEFDWLADKGAPGFQLMLTKLARLSELTKLPKHCRVVGWGVSDLGAELTRYDRSRNEGARQRFVDYELIAVNSTQKLMIADMLIIEVVDEGYVENNPIDVAWKQPFGQKHVDGKEMDFGDLELLVLNFSGQNLNRIWGEVKHKTELCREWKNVPPLPFQELPNNFEKFEFCCPFAPDGKLRAAPFSRIVDIQQVSKGEVRRLPVRELGNLSEYTLEAYEGNFPPTCSERLITSISYDLRATAELQQITTIGQLTIERGAPGCGDGGDALIYVDFENLQPGETRVLRKAISLPPKQSKRISLSLSDVFEGKFSFRFHLYHQGSKIAQSKIQTITINPTQPAIKSNELPQSDDGIYVGSRLTSRGLQEGAKLSSDLPRVVLE